MAYLLPLAIKGVLGLAAVVGLGAAAFLPPVAAVVVIVLALLILLWAPYRVWSATQLRLDRVGERLQPKLRVSLDQPRRSPDGLRQFVRLRVDNGGHEQVEGCQGKLLDAKPLQRISVPLPEPGQNLMWSTRGGEVSMVPVAKRSIDPKSHEYLDVAFTDNFIEEFAANRIKNPTPAIRARVRELLDAEFPYFHFVFADFRAWRMPEGDYDVVVEVSAENVETPTPIPFRIVYRNYLNLYWEALDSEDAHSQ